MSAEYCYDPHQVLGELIDHYIPEPHVPLSVVRSYLEELFGHENGLSLISSGVGPVTGWTVGTALVQCRQHRWRPSLHAPSTLLPWLYEQGFDPHAPDGWGHTTFFQALLFETPSGSNAWRDIAQDKGTFAWLLDTLQFDPLVVSPANQSLLQCTGQSSFFQADHLCVVRARISQALSRLIPEKAWAAVQRMERGGVSQVLSAWWELERSRHHHAFLDLGWNAGSTGLPRPRL